MLNLTLFHNLAENQTAPDFDIVLHNLINPMEQMLDHLLPKHSPPSDSYPCYPDIFDNETTVGVEITQHLVDTGVK